MAEIIPTTGKKVAELLVKEAKFLHRATKEIESVKTKLEDIGSRLKNADVMTDGDKTWDEWGSQLRDVAFQTEDVIEVSVNNVTVFDGYNVLQLVMGCCRQITTLHILKNEMDDINSKLKELDELSKTSLTTRTRSREDGENSTHHDHREEDLAASSGSDDDEDDLVGFLKEADELASLLKKEEPLGQLAVFPIWAEGGAGKTALARTIYKKEEVKSQFDCIAWVSVSQNYLVNSIWQSILKQVKELTEEEEKELQTEGADSRRKVYDYLNKKNYLIVLDNLWARKDWELIAKAFPNSPQKKCRVLVTTRMGEVARVANSVTDDPLQLRVLNEKESLELLLKKVFPSSLYKESKDSLTKEMKIVAGKMLDKCEGLPIAIVLLGGILHKGRKDIFEWTDILERVQSDLTKSGDRLAKLVALSYNVLPSHLKSCFLYFGLFPKNSAIECDKLIRLWVAEGFLGSKDDKAMEDEGRTCLKELIQRCMIQVIKCKSNGDPQTCRINDLVRALAVQEARKAKFSSICEEDYLEPKKDCRRMALHHKIIDFHGTSTAPDLLSSLQQSILKPPVVEGNDHLRLVGFQKEEDKLASLLTEETPMGRLSIVSVMGMEGGGKTALAQKVFNRDDVKSHFACRAWVYVSQNYGVKDLLKTMVQQLTWKQRRSNCSMN